MLKLRNWILAAVAALTIISNAPAQTVAPGSVLIVYDSSGQYGWIGGIHARMLANLLGHFDLPYVISPVESYHAGDMNTARATFYLGTVYDNPLPAVFKADVLTTTNTLCWFRYNLWQVADTNFTAKFGYQFNWLDWSGYSNIVYKGESFLKNQLDPELGYVTVLDTNLVSVPSTAVMTDTNGATIASIPYVVRSGKFWYVADVPFEYMSEEDRYLIFADLLHDILGINHPESHRAIIRLEDVAPTMYEPSVLRQTADLLKSNNIPYAIAFVPVYADPLGFYNSGVSETHRLADAGDASSVEFASTIRYMMANGAQLIIHGYTHQYSNVANPYDGCTGDDFEFFRETFNTTTADPYDLDLYGPVPEDSVAWTLGRINAAKTELAQVGLSAVGWEFPHYAASALDYRVVATNFPCTMQRVLYFDDAGHVAGQMFPYVINRDIYGQKVIPENLGNIEPTTWQNYPARSAADMVRTAKKNLVVRDGWASGYFHPFYDLTNLQAIVTGIKALGYTYVQVSASEPPSITTQPVSRTNNAGTTATFSVAAVGAPALKYQWRFKSAALAGQTNATLNLANVQAANAGNYDVVVSNPFGSVTSFSTALTVTTAAPVIMSQPASRTNVVGTSASFSVIASGATPLTYRWKFNGANIANATNATYTITSVQAANAGSYTVAITNATGSATSAAATLTVVSAPGITTQPISRTNNAGTTATFTVAATGSGTLTYQWQFNNANIVGATGATLNLTNLQSANTGSYRVLVANAYASVTSAVATLTVVSAPVIISQPVSRTNVSGTSASFSVSASSTAPLTYRWKFNGANIANATNATYTIASVQVANAGGYTVAITNAAGSATSAAATLTVMSAPSITTQPASRTNGIGTSTTFNVTATGSGTLTYQWQFNNANIAGATSATLTLASVQTANAGNYRVLVANAYGAVTSAPAALTVKAVAPAITTQPASRTNVVGSTASFSVTASGTAPFTYQWRFNGANIAGATNSTFTRPSVTTAQAGNYTVVVANAAGAVTSATAVLTVGTSPAITTQPQSQVVRANRSVTFNVAAGGSSPLSYQWRFNGANIAGATGSSYSISTVKAANAGSYSVVVANPFGAATSANAVLTVQ